MEKVFLPTALCAGGNSRLSGAVVRRLRASWRLLFQRRHSVGATGHAQAGRLAPRGWGALLAGGLAVAGWPLSTLSAEVRLAVASNLAAPMPLLASDFAGRSGHRALVSYGATGKLYAQITHGAPFDVLLAADTDTPSRLAREGLAVAKTQRTYAVGRLALWSAQPGRIQGDASILRQGSFRHLALANPRTAPYGVAAMEVLARLGLEAVTTGKQVLGENIGQTHQFVRAGAADLGFVALSQVWLDGRLAEGSVWVVPADHHTPLRQDAILLTRGSSNPAAAAFLSYLGSPAAAAIFQRFGYDLPAGGVSASAK